MAPIQPQKKEQILTEVANDIIDKYYSQNVGLYKANKPQLQEYLSRADNNKDGNYAIYHLIKALVHGANSRYEDARESYLAALKLNPNSVPILGNYVTLLVDMNRYKEAYELISVLIKNHKLVDVVVVDGLYRMALNTLDISYFEDFSKYPDIINPLEITKQLIELKKDIKKIDISLQEYTEVMTLVSQFVLENTRQSFNPRFSICNGLDRHLMIEVFLDVNLQQASFLNLEFTTILLDHIFENNRHKLLGKFVLFFKQKNNRYDGNENHNNLYLGINEELVT